MPWDCKSCHTAIERDDVLICPSCGGQKEAWSMVADRTRTFAVTRSKKVKYLKGEGGEVCSQGGAPYPDVTCVDAEEAVALPKTVARRLARKEQLPAPQQVLFVRMKPPETGGDLTVTLTPEYETREVSELTFPHEGEPASSAEGDVDVRFLFVYGDGEDVTLPGVHVVDISEDTEQGFAPQVGVKALVRKRRVLPISGEWREFEFSV